MIRIGILGSTRGTHLIALFEAIKEKTLAARIEVVVSNQAQALILEKAIQFGVAHRFINAKDLSPEAFDQQLSAVFESFQVDLIVLVGYMRILSPGFVQQWAHKIINVHPSLLPAFSGLMDLKVHQAVLNAGARKSGCTVHYVTEEVDAGPIILQMDCPVYTEDSVENLKARVQKLEAKALIESIQLFANKKE